MWGKKGHCRDDVGPKKFNVMRGTSNYTIVFLFCSQSVGSFGFVLYEIGDLLIVGSLWSQLTDLIDFQVNLDFLDFWGLENCSCSFKTLMYILNQVI